MKKILCMLCAVLLLASCNNNNSSTTQNQTATSKNEKTLHIYIYKGAHHNVVDPAIEKLRKIFDKVVVEEIAIPQKAYYAPDHRYKAKILIQDLRKRTKDDLVLGITDKDIGANIHGVDDFGVMGLTLTGLKTSVVTDFRLWVKGREQSDFYKLCLHELGHAEGLPHCEKGQTCILRDAKKKNHLGGLDSFCPSCTEYLVKKGWHLQ